MASMPKGAPRVRRDPEEARRVILDAAERLVAARGPDAVGLKDVAREAGVSHALVSHYFGTYLGLVDAVLERRALVVRERIVADLAAPGGEVDTASALERLWSWVSDPLTMRLTAWAALAGRQHTSALFPARVQGLRRVTDLLDAELRARGVSVGRERLEFVIEAAVALAFGHALVGSSIRRSLGRPADRDAEATFRARVRELLERELGRR